MTVYALAHLRTPTANAEVVRYLERIQETLTPYGGRFLVHGPKVEVVEGEWPGTVVILEFAKRDDAHAWYESPEYQEILPLRTNNIEADVILVDGVPPGYDARLTADRMRASLEAS